VIDRCMEYEKGAVKMEIKRKNWHLSSWWEIHSKAEDDTAKGRRMCYSVGDDMSGRHRT
jgi:hypothetical protein